MGKPMTKAKTITVLAEKLEMPKKAVATFLETLAALAYKEAKNGFVFPGVGKLVVRQYKARQGVNPPPREKINLPARKRLKFVGAKAAKDAVL